MGKFLNASLRKLIMIKYCIPKVVLFAVALLSCQTKEGSKDGTVEAHFSRQEGIEWVIEKELDNAGKSVSIAIYNFTSRPLAQAVLDAHKRGVDVKVIMDPSNANATYSKAFYLNQNGIEVRVERGRGLMHNKFALIDDSILITGSFNWTASAEAENDENIVILKGFPNTYRSYSREFSRLWQESEPWQEKSPEPVDIHASNLRLLKKNAGKNVKISGRVVRVGYSEKSNTYFLDFSEDRSGLTVVIFSSVVGKFERLGLSIEDYEGDSVEVAGELVDDSKYGLEIILEEPSQVKVLAEKTTQ